MESQSQQVLDYTHVGARKPNRALAMFSKFLVFSTLFLIFAGSLVTSTGTGLSVPDWPTTYGHFMFSFPLKDMVGGIFYEHGHRMIASIVGMLTLINAVWVAFAERRRWIKWVAFVALLAVICQGILGGLTVLYFLPTSVSVSHAMLAQTFLLMTVVMAYSFSKERRLRSVAANQIYVRSLARSTVFVLVCIYLQLFLGALMRHSAAGLAIPDFPTMAGSFWPTMDKSMLSWINNWRFEKELDPVNMFQVSIHLAHRLGAMLVTGAFIGLAITFWKNRESQRHLTWHMVGILGLVTLQVCLGIFTVWSGKNYMITSFHVVSGAAILAFTVLFLLRVLPLKWSDLGKS